MGLRERILGAESRWIMGRVMAGDFLKGVGEHLNLVAPEREDELMAAIKARAEELAEADEDMVVDNPSEGALGGRCGGTRVLRDAASVVRWG